MYRASEYEYKIAEEDVNGRNAFVATVVDFPFLTTDGASHDEALKEAVCLVVDALRICETEGDDPPVPLSRTLGTHDFGNGPEPAHRHLNPDGSVGGWVAETATVDATCYVGPDARVYGNARVSGNARVFDNAWVSYKAIVSGNAYVYGNSWVYGNARVSGNAKVYDTAHIYDTACVFGNAQVYGNASISGNAHISGDARVYGNARVSGNAHISGDARIC